VFESLSDKRSGVFERVRARGALSEADVTEALREVRLALLDADVALPGVRDVVAKVRERAIGAEVLSSVTPGQQVVATPEAPLPNTVDLMAALKASLEAARKGKPAAAAPAKEEPEEPQEELAGAF